MKAKKLLIFLLCFVMLVGALAVVASAKGATETESYTEVKNSDGSVTTSYGKLSSTYASAETYPFGIFRYKNGTLQSSEGQKTMKGAFDSAKNWNNTWTKIKNADGTNAGKNDTENTYRATIVLRRDYTTTSSDKYDNYAQTQNEVIIDLNGYTLTQGTGTSGLFYQVTTKGSSSQGYIFDTTFTIKNGNIAVNTSPVFYGNMWNSIYGVAADKLNGKTMADKNFTWNFDNVKFSYVSGGTATNMMIGYTGPQSVTSNPPSEVAPYNFNYTDCTFDLTNAPASVTLFNAAPGNASTNYWLKVTVTVKGCEIVANANNLTSLKLYAVESNHNSGSSVNFVADENGDVLTLVLPEGQTPPVPTSTTYVTIGGKQLYWHNVDGAYVLAECAATGENHAVCSCGVITGDCVDENTDNVCDLCSAMKVGGVWISNENVSAYPFVILDANGNYVSAKNSFKGAVTDAAAKDGYTVLMIADYKTVGTLDAGNSLKALKGEVVIDLNGNTLTRGYNGSYLFDNWWDAGTTADTVTVNFKNGNINAEKWLINLSGNNAIANEKTANFVFDNVNFKFMANNDKADGWVIVVHSQTYNKQITSNITFDDCTFDTTDMRTSITMGSAPVLNLDVNNKSGVDYVKTTVTFNGGKVIANRFATYALYQVHADDTVTFGKGDNGEYLVLEMQGGKTPEKPAAADYITVDGTKMYFHKNGNVYTLSECLDAATHHKCTCGFVFSADCTDANKDHICDVCGKKSECIDENKDHVCDLCDKTYTCAEADFDKNHVCDFCGSSFACADANKDEICDHCGYVMNNYGIKNIDPKYADVEKYPFFVLKLENGVYSFSGAYNKFYGRQNTSAINQALYGVLRDSNKYDLENGVYVPEKSGGAVVTAVVVMRRDYTIKMGNSKMDASTGVEYYDNIAHAQGEVIIDLGGHSLIEAEGSNKSVFTVTAKGWTGTADGVYTFPSTYTFKNGTVKSLKYAFVTIGTNDAIDVPHDKYTGDPADWHWSLSNAVMNVNFENVTFGLAEGATTATLAYATGSASNKYSSVAKVNVSFTDCIFDLKTVAPTKATTIINHNTSGKDVDEDIVVNGCEIIANNMANVTVCTNTNANGSSLVFAKGENGKYITLTMPKGTKAPAATNTFVLDTGVVAAFNKSATAGDNDTYSVYPAVMLGYKIKTSVTLYTNFIYNVYVPVANVNKISVNGVVVGYEETEVDGVSYYLVKVNLAAAESLSDIKVTVTLNSGETTVDANWTLSVLKYTGSVINGNYNKVTKNLMKDMLAYATAAHNYFDNALSAEKAAMVESLLAGYSVALPTGEAKTPANSTYFKEIAVNVGAVPSFRFYLQSGYSIADFDFTVGGKAVNAVEGSDDRGAYLDVAMFAYMMLDDVTYNVKANGETGTYNLYSYYNYASKLNIENLTAIVEGLMKYSVSAELYRDYVINNTCYHVYVDGKCTECGADDPDVGTMSISAPASIYSNYAGKDISVTFSKSWYKGEVTWTTDNENVKVENGKIFATGTFSSAVDVTVTATTKDHTASVIVNVSTFNGYGHDVSVEKKVQWYEANFVKEENKGGIIFVGDSYLDGHNAAPYGTGVPSFYRDFYADWAGEKAFLMGMSSSIIEDLEVASERIVYPMEPSEIVIHIGHNDMHSYSTTAEAFVAKLQALVNEYHSKLPNATIYFLSVDPKRDSADPKNARHESSFVKVPAVNAAMQAFAKANDWVTYVDTTDIFYTKNTAGELIAVNKNMYPSSDASHPTLVAYDLIKIKLDEARGKTLDNVININNADKHYSIGAGGKTYTVSGDYVISGRLVMTQFVKANAHLNFHFGTAKGNSRPYRFLLWDATFNGYTSDSKFGIGYEKLGSYTTENETGNPVYDATNGLVLNWTIIVKDSNAYCYVGGKLQAVFENAAITNTFSIDATGMDVVLYDIDLIQKSNDEAAYNNYIAPYFAEDVVNIKMYGQNGDINKNGKTFTDASGNALTNNYIVKGKLNIVDFGKSNPHIQFRFGSGSRFLLWDSNRDGKFGAGNDGASDTAEGITLYNANGGLVLDWAVVVSEGKAYWYINGKLERTFENPTLTGFNIGALQMDAYLYDIEMFVKSDNATAYTEELGNYFSDNFEISNYDGTAASTLSGTGPTYTKDTFGNELKGSNYVISGSLTITKMNMGANMHLQFYFCNGWRFLLWDQAGNGKFGPGYQENGTHKNDSQVGEKYDGTSGTLTLDWAVVVKDNMAYWFINGELVKTFTEPSTDAFRTINIGATKMVVSVNDVVIYAQNGSSDYYNATVSKYNV